MARVGGFGGKADSLNYFNTFTGDPNLVNTSIDDYLAVQCEDILRACERTLDHRQVRMKVRPEDSYTPSVTGIDRTVMPPGPGSQLHPPIPQRRTLPNGLGVTVVEKRDLPIVSFGLLVSGGTSSDPETQPGLASLTSQMLSEGTETRTSQQIAEEFEFMGARLHSETRRETAFFSTETLTRHWPAALALMADVLLRPTFPDHEWDRVQREHITDLQRARDDAGFIAEQVMPGLLFGLTSPYGHPSHGTEESVAAITTADLRRHYQSSFGPSGANLLVAGDASLDEVMEQAAAAFGTWTGPDQDAASDSSAFVLKNTAPTTLYLVDKPGAAQSIIRAGHLMVDRKHPDYFNLLLLNFAFGGQFSARLNQNLRQDKGYSYGFHSSINWYRQPSPGWPAAACRRPSLRSLSSRP